MACRMQGRMAYVEWPTKAFKRSMRAQGVSWTGYQPLVGRYGGSNGRLAAGILLIDDFIKREHTVLIVNSRRR
jgi:hypothetical protein